MTQASSEQLLAHIDALTAERDALAAEREEFMRKAESWRQTALVCSGALSKISYLVGPPNAMEVAAYDVHHQPDMVVNEVAAFVSQRFRASSTE